MHSQSFARKPQKTPEPEVIFVKPYLASPSNRKVSTTSRRCRKRHQRSSHLSWTMQHGLAQLKSGRPRPEAKAYSRPKQSNLVISFYARKLLYMRSSIPRSPSGQTQSTLTIKRMQSLEEVRWLLHRQPSRSSRKTHHWLHHFISCIVMGLGTCHQILLMASR